jgi:uncharacterized protein YjgD (DUF1641 family)
MAKPLTFTPPVVDFKADLMKKLEHAPYEHAEALLLAYDVLEEARKQGLLDLLHGAIGAKDTILHTVSKYAAEPEGVAAIRNLLTAAKILSELDPEVLDQVSKAMQHATKEHQQEQKVPGLWQLARRATSEDSRRGLSFMTLVLLGLGRSLKR